MPSISVADQKPTGPQLDAPPPRPPRQGKSIMAMATDAPSGMMDMSNPAIQVMQAMGEARNALMKLASMLPLLAPGIQQIVMGLEQVVPQQVADIVAGNPPGSGGSGMAAAGAAAQPEAPPVQTGVV